MEGMTTQEPTEEAQRFSIPERREEEAGEINSSSARLTSNNADQERRYAGLSSPDPDRSTPKKPRLQEGRSQASADEEKPSINLPLDVWILVAEHLDPRSLLRMTRINKPLRAVLTSKRSSKSIWTRLASQLKLPAVDDHDSSLIALFSYLYEDICCVCSQPGATFDNDRTRTRWHYRLREKEKVSPEAVSKLVIALKRQTKLAYDREDALYEWRDQASKTRDKELGTEWYQIAAPFTAAVAHARVVRTQGERKNSLYTRFKAYRKRKIAQDFDLFPPFSTFLCLDSIKGLWEPEPSRQVHSRWSSSFIEGLDAKWETALVRLEQELPQARRWLKICYVRIMLSALEKQRIPFSSSFLDALNPGATSTLTESFVNPSPSSFNLNDPATVSTSALDEILSRYSTQAWYGQKFDHVTFFDAHRQATEIHFPTFNTKWHLVLLHVLETADVSDGPLDVVAATLKKLGHGFFCGQCAWRPKGTSVSVILQHVDTHLHGYDFDNSESPLIVYQDPTSQLPPPQPKAVGKPSSKAGKKSKSRSSK
ncbi:hypothetical protein JCM11491_002500 [Sporobolomyces phaffii]